MVAPVVAASLITGGAGLLGGILNNQARDSRQTVQSSGSNQGVSQFNPHPLASPLYGQMGGIGQQMGQTPTPYFPGQGYVGPSGPTQQGVNMGMGSLPYYGQAANQALAAQPMMQAGLGMAGRNYGFLSGAADVGNNPYVQQMMQANAGILNEQLQEQWLPALESGFSRTGAGAVGSSRHGLAQSEAIQNTAKELGRSNAGLLLGAYGQGLGAQQNALGQTGNMLRNLMVPSAATADAAAYLDQGGRTGLQYGQATEGYQQRALDDAMARFGWQYQEPWMRAQSLGGILGSLQPLGRSYNAGSSAGNIPNPNYQSGGNAFLQGALGGAGVGYNIWDRWNQSRSGSQMGLNYGQHANSLANTVYPF